MRRDKLLISGLVGLFLLVAADRAAGQTRLPTEPAQAAAGPSAPRSHRAIWTAVGAGAGFGLGVLAGLHWFDDALFAERKIWTTAMISAAAGGVAGNLLSRPRASAPSGPRTTPPVPVGTRRTTVVVPVLGPRTVGFVYSTRF